MLKTKTNVSKKIADSLSGPPLRGKSSNSPNPSIAIPIHRESGEGNKIPSNPSEWGRGAKH